MLLPGLGSAFRTWLHPPEQYSWMMCSVQYSWQTSQRCLMISPLHILGRGHEAGPDALCRGRCGVVMSGGSVDSVSTLVAWG